jgi:hypothetical protein
VKTKQPRRDTSDPTLYYNRLCGSYYPQSLPRIGGTTSVQGLSYPSQYLQRIWIALLHIAPTYRDDITSRCALYETGARRGLSV